MCSTCSRAPRERASTAATARTAAHRSGMSTPTVTTLRRGWLVSVQPDGHRHHGHVRVGGHPAGHRQGHGAHHPGQVPALQHHDPGVRPGLEDRRHHRAPHQLAGSTGPARRGGPRRAPRPRAAWRARSARPRRSRGGPARDPSACTCTACSTCSPHCSRSACAAAYSRALSTGSLPTATTTGLGFSSDMATSVDRRRSADMTIARWLNPRATGRRALGTNVPRPPVRRP